MKRNEIVLSIPGHRLEEAARTKQQHHNSRRAEYMKEADQLLVELRGKGSVDLRVYPVTGGVQQVSTVVVDIDSDKIRRTNECYAKAKEHGDKADEYDRWARGFALNPKDTFELEPDDVEYFGL